MQLQGLNSLEFEFSNGMFVIYYIKVVIIFYFFILWIFHFIGIKVIKCKSDKEIPVIGVGGVMNAKDFNKKIDAGSELVQIYTGFVIKGPNILNDILEKDD